LIGFAKAVTENAGRFLSAFLTRGKQTRAHDVRCTEHLRVPVDSAENIRDRDADVIESERRRWGHIETFRSLRREVAFVSHGVAKVATWRYSWRFDERS
jgi:hypothetical protein